jgi:hypothetical protein
MFNQKVIAIIKSPLEVRQYTRICQIESFSKKFKNNTIKSNEEIEINVSSDAIEMDIDTLVLKIGQISAIEIETLKKSRDTCYTIVKMEGYASVISKNPCILIEKAESNITKIKRPISESQTELFQQIFSSLLTFFKDSKLVYCDWKPDNLFNFGDNTFKLGNLESCQIEDVKINHPNNINLIYSSPYLMNLTTFDLRYEITPRHRDDIIGIAYIFLWLTNYNMPWAEARPEKSLNNESFDYRAWVYDAKVNKKICRIPYERLSILDEDIYEKALENIYYDFK